MNHLIITIDVDWACEPAIEDTLDFFENQQISPTVFVTHRSPRIEAHLGKLEVGLHPYFDPNSSHGSTIPKVVNHVMELPHNIPAFRCHRFANCNVSRQALWEAGMLISSNTCTDLEIIPPFKDRFGLLEVPIFLEDGGYLWRKHPLEVDEHLKTKLYQEGIKVILIHPMHFAINTPNFEYMHRIKQSMDRKAWNGMTRSTLNDLRWKGRGIRDLMTELIQNGPKTLSLRDLMTPR